MKARLFWLPLLIGIVVVLSGCPGLFGGPDGDSDDESADTTPPTEVTELEAVRSSGTVALKWIDPTDEDLAGIEVTWEPGGSETQEVALGVGEYVATGLTNGTEYTFTLAAVDESGNRSAGETITVTPYDDAVIYTGTGSITLPDGSSVSLTGAAFDGEEDLEGGVYIYGVVLYGGDITVGANGLTGTGPLVWIDIDEFSGHTDEPQSGTYEFGGAAEVTETRGSFVELGAIDSTTLTDYLGGEGPFADAGQNAAVAFHIFDDAPSWDNIDPGTLAAGFTEVDGERGPSAGSTLNIDFSLDGGGAWDIEFTF
jgi:hypothetical protein